MSAVGVISLERSDRLAALRVAADVLKASQPASVASVSVRVGPNVFWARAEWRWPGVVRVTHKYTGQLLARSLPGRPYELADD